MTSVQSLVSRAEDSSQSRSIERLRYRQLVEESPFERPASVFPRNLTLKLVFEDTIGWGLERNEARGG